METKFGIGIIGNSTDFGKNMQYYTKTPGIGGQIKRRFADFVVEEIAPSGEICKVECFNENGVIDKPVEWPDMHADFDQLIVIMEKFNVDLNNAVSRVARSMGFSKNRIGYAGMKDKRAITAQRISLWQPDIKKLKNFRSRQVVLRSPHWEKDRIEIGDLKGNKFTINIRDLKLGKDELEKIILGCFEEMKEGIPNYFGEQRFGGARNITHLVGKEFLRGNFKEGIMLYLTHTFEGEEPEIKAARESLAKSLDFKKAVTEFPAKFRYERAIIHSICKYPNDFIGAFRKLPKKLQYLFTHAYQSHLFNAYIEERLKAGLGLKAVEGDVLHNDIPQGPLFGFEFEFAGGKLGEIEKKVLEREGIELSNFKVDSFPELSTKGIRKDIVLFPENLELLGIGEDEFYPGSLKAKVAFSLSKGNYATTVLEELMKTKV